LLEKAPHRRPRLQHTGYGITVSSIAGDAGFTVLHDGWQVKKTLEKTISNPYIDGGFILFYCEPDYQEQLRHALSDLTEIPIGFDPQGMKVIYVGEDHW
jgi:galactokinase/mevalonate kinase-like predicted kinase